MYLIILFFISSIGGILYFFKRLPEKLLQILLALGAGAMFSVALVHILPETINLHSQALYAFVLGFLIIYSIEEIFRTHSHDHPHHDHVHEDPHEHSHHVAIVACIAISIHTIFDGVGIASGYALNTQLGTDILVGVAIHQIPVSLAIVSILQSSRFSRKTQIALLCIFASAAPIGAIVSGGLLQTTLSTFVPLATALAGGSLLYVSNVELLPMVHDKSTPAMKYIIVACFIFGVVGMSVIGK